MPSPRIVSKENESKLKSAEEAVLQSQLDLDALRGRLAEKEAAFQNLNDRAPDLRRRHMLAGDEAAMLALRSEVDTARAWRDELVTAVGEAEAAHSRAQDAVHRVKHADHLRRVRRRVKAYMDHLRECSRQQEIQALNWRKAFKLAQEIRDGWPGFVGNTFSTNAAHMVDGMMLRREDLERCWNHSAYHFGGVEDALVVFDENGQRVIAAHPGFPGARPALELNGKGTTSFDPRATPSLAQRADHAEAYLHALLFPAGDAE